MSLQYLTNIQNMQRKKIKQTCKYFWNDTNMRRQTRSRPSSNGFLLGCKFWQRRSQEIDAPLKFQPQPLEQRYRHVQISFYILQIKNTKHLEFSWLLRGQLGALVSWPKTSLVCNLLFHCTQLLKVIYTITQFLYEIEQISLLHIV